MKRNVIGVIFVVAWVGLLTACITSSKVEVDTGPLTAPQILQEMDTIANETAVVWPEGQSSEEFKEQFIHMSVEEFHVWVAYREYEINKFVTLLKLYSATEKVEDHKIVYLKQLSDSMVQNHRDLGYAQAVYFGKDTPKGERNDRKVSM